MYLKGEAASDFLIRGDLNGNDFLGATLSETFSFLYVKLLEAKTDGLAGDVPAEVEGSGEFGMLLSENRCVLVILLGSFMLLRSFISYSKPDDDLLFEFIEIGKLFVLFLVKSDLTRLKNSTISNPETIVIMINIDNATHATERIKINILTNILNVHHKVFNKVYKKFVGVSGFNFRSVEREYYFSALRKIQRKVYPQLIINSNVKTYPRTLCVIKTLSLK